MSHDLLDDLLADVPDRVRADVPAAWRDGTRRRRVSRSVGVVSAATVIGLGSLGLTWLDSGDRTSALLGDTGAVGGYPAELDKPFFEAPLPDRSGPLAGALQTGDGDWHMVDDNGRAWSLDLEPDAFPALSDSGTQLGGLHHVAEGHAVYETVDLTTGVRNVYDDVGAGYTSSGEPTTDQRFSSAPQRPAYWSPDDARLVIQGGSTDGTRVEALLLEDGRVTPLETPGYAIGWTSPSEIAWLDYDVATVRITDLSGDVVRSVALDLGRGSLSVNQWSGRVSQDGDRLALLGAQGDRVRLWVLSLAGPTAAGNPLRPPISPDQISCPPSWVGDRVGVFQDIRLASYPGGEAVVDFSDHWGVRRCSVWAAAALAGPAQPPPGASEWRYWKQWWVWRQLLVGTALIVALVVVWAVRRRRRHRDPQAGEDAVDWWGGDAT